jgi:hypothetical protein
MRFGIRRSVIGAAVGAALAGCGSKADFTGSSQTKVDDHRTSAAAPSNVQLGDDANAANGSAAPSGVGPGQDSTDGDLPGHDVPSDPPGTDPSSGTNPTPPSMPPSAPTGSPDPNGTDQLLTREMTFPTSRTLSSQVLQDLAQATLAQTLALMSSTVAKSSTVTQGDRPNAEDDFVQGHADLPINETFTGVAAHPLDVLLVLDNSCDMDNVAGDLATKLAPLLSQVAAADWQIGVVTTDPNASCLRQLVKKTDQNPAGELAQAVSVGTSGDSNPRGILQAVRSLSGTCLTTPWIRSGSDLEIVIVSAKDNCDDGNGCPGKAYATANYLTDYLKTIRTPGKDAHVHGVYVPPGTNNCAVTNEAVPAAIYSQAVSTTGGSAGDICQENFTPALNAIGSVVTTNLDTTFTLKYPPEAGTLAVSVNGTALPATGYTLTGNVLQLATPLAAGATLLVTYKELDATLKTQFVLRFQPLAGSVNVTVDGVAASAGAYTVDSTVPAVDFGVAPAAGAKIAVTYIENTPLQTQFKLDSAPLANSLTAYENGQATTDYTFDATTNTVTFTTAPASDTVITFAYNTLGAPILTYPLALGATAPSGLTVVDATTKTPITFTYANDTLTIAAASFQNGRQLLVTYDNPAHDQATVQLPQTPVAGSVVATAGGVSCSTAPDLTVQGSTVTLSGCPFPADATQVVVSYQYVQTYQDFTFNAPNLPGPMDFQSWTVWVNDQPTTDYTRNGNAFHFPDPLPLAGTVRIQLQQKPPAVPANPAT